MKTAKLQRSTVALLARKKSLLHFIRFLAFDPSTSLPNWITTSEPKFTSISTNSSQNYKIYSTTIMIEYDCPCPEPGTIAEPYHIPGYSGHIPTMKRRNGKSFGNTSREIIEDPCVGLAPIPVLQAPCRPCPPNDCWINPVGCGDMGCCEPTYCPPKCIFPKFKKPPCEPANVPPFVECCDPRAHHMNRGPYACPCRPEPDTDVYRCCEPMSSSYAGYIPGFTFHSTGRTTGVASFGTKAYMQNCFYSNNFAKM